MVSGSRKFFTSPGTSNGHWSAAVRGQKEIIVRSWQINEVNISDTVEDGQHVHIYLFKG